MPTVRTTMRPDQEIEVTDIEANDLDLMGLLVKATPAPPAAPAPVTKKAAPSAATKEG
jgi:hypothetical protein